MKKYLITLLGCFLTPAVMAGGNPTTDPTLMSMTFSDFSEQFKLSEMLDKAQKKMEDQIMAMGDFGNYFDFSLESLFDSEYNPVAGTVETVKLESPTFGISGEAAKDSLSTQGVLNQLVFMPAESTAAALKTTSETEAIKNNQKMLKTEVAINGLGKAQVDKTIAAGDKSAQQNSAQKLANAVKTERQGAQVAAQTAIALVTALNGLNDKMAASLAVEGAVSITQIETPNIAVSDGTTDTTGGGKS